MDGLRPMWAAFRLGLGNFRARPRNALLIAAGLLVASFTVLVLLTLSAGLKRIAGRTGLPDVAVVLSGSGFDETDGGIDPELVARIGVLPGVALRSDGSPRIAPQFVVTSQMPRRDGASGTLLVRGVSPQVWDVVGDAVRLAEGKRPEAGVMELISGTTASQIYPFTDTGANLSLVKRSTSQWTVSGEFSAGNGLWESELWADLENLRGQFNADGQTTSVWVRLVSPDALKEFAAAMQADPRLRGLKVYRQNGFYAQRVMFLDLFVRAASLVIAIVLGVLAILAGNSSIGLALRARRRELAVLRAMGYGNGALFVALLLEVILLAVFCALFAAATAWLLLHAHQVDSSSAGISIRFAMEVTGGVVGLVVAYAVALGIVSAIVPAWRALHAPLVKSLASE